MYVISSPGLLPSPPDCDWSPLSLVLFLGAGPVGVALPQVQSLVCS